MGKEWSSTAFKFGALHRHENTCDRNAWSKDLSQTLLQKMKLESKAGKPIFAFTMGRPHTLPFCAGGNLSEYKNKSRAQVLQIHRKISETLKDIPKQKILTIACVGGDVWGGGWEILSSFDMVMSHPEVRFHFQQMKWGVGPGWGGGKRVLERHPEILPTILEGGVLEARALHKMGFIHELISPNSFWKDQSLAHLIECRFSHLENIEKSSWQKLIDSLRKKNHLAERQAFEGLWGRGRHQKLFTEWTARKK